MNVLFGKKIAWQMVVLIFALQPPVPSGPLRDWSFGTGRLDVSYAPIGPVMNDSNEKMMMVASGENCGTATCIAQLLRNNYCFVLTRVDYGKYLALSPRAHVFHCVQCNNFVLPESACEHLHVVAMWQFYLSSGDCLFVGQLDYVAVLSAHKCLSIIHFFFSLQCDCQKMFFFLPYSLCRVENAIMAPIIIFTDTRSEPELHLLGLVAIPSANRCQYFFSILLNTDCAIFEFYFSSITPPMHFISSYAFPMQ